MVSYALLLLADHRIWLVVFPRVCMAPRNEKYAPVAENWTVPHDLKTERISEQIVVCLVADAPDTLA